MSDSLTIALAGNPNCGKTALFNALTGLRQHVGNWPGVTVERKEGEYKFRDRAVKVVDLPGTYSLSVPCVGALDEKLACEYLLSGEVDILVNVIDGTNLVRNLYLTLQLLEMGLPMVLAVNMMDIVEKRGLSLNLKKLQKLMGCPVVPLVASRGKGIDLLQQAVHQFREKAHPSSYELTLPKPLQTAVENIALQLQQRQGIKISRAKWLALRLFEQDCYAESQVNAEIIEAAELQQRVVETETGEEVDILIADARYSCATEISAAVSTLQKTPRQTVTELLDRVVLNRFLGIPLFFFIMYLMFVFAINIGGAFQDFFDLSSAAIFVDGLAHLLMSWHWPAWLIALFANGLGKGINTVVTFAPVIGAMFLLLAVLEDSGYMARAAFVMDRGMRALGLPGKSFVPMIVGFGCNVPAVMAARTLANPRDRILTVMMMPFMSCGARLAIFSVFASAFFPKTGAGIIFLLYVIGILVAVLSGLVLRKTLLPGKPTPLVMELPPYHWPHARSLLQHAWDRLRGFLLRAGKYIVPICVLIGVLNSISMNGHLVDEGNPKSMLAAVGRVVTPVFAPMGIQQDNWPATVGLATGVLAKEVVVGSLNSLYTSLAHENTKAETWSFVGELQQAVRSVPENLAGLAGAFINPLQASEAPHDMTKSAYGEMYQRFAGVAGAFAYLLFVLLYFPCISTMAAMRREVSTAWATFSLLWSTGLAYALSVITFQLLTFLQHPLQSLLWSLGMSLALFFAVLLMRYAAYSNKSGRGNSFVTKLKTMEQV